MKIPILLNRLRSAKKHFKNTRLIVTLTVVAVLLVSVVSVAAYTMNLQKKKQPVAEKVQSKPTPPTSKAELNPPVVKEKPESSDGTQSAPVQTNKSAAMQITKPKPHTSGDPAFVACTQKYNELYVKYNADNASINAEKRRALAEIDELYNSGFYEDTYPGGAEAYNHWQADRAELEADYSNQLVDLYNAYQASSSAYLNC